jgi:hypothetical protein
MWCMQRRRGHRLFPGRSLRRRRRRGGAGLRQVREDPRELGGAFGAGADRDAAPSGHWQLRPPARGPKPASGRLAGGVSALRLPSGSSGVTAPAEPPCPLPPAHAAATGEPGSSIQQRLSARTQPAVLSKGHGGNVTVEMTSSGDSRGIAFKQKPASALFD